MTHLWGPARESGPQCPRVGVSVRPSRAAGAEGEVAAPPGLASRQAALVAALVAGGPPPPGFDADRLVATRRALLRKRAGEAAKVWPLLAATPRWTELFVAHHDGEVPVGALRDGWDVARALRDRGRLGPGAATELADREAVLRYDGHTAPRPRFRIRVLRALRRWTGLR